jgi:hypothetical protein
MSENPLYRWSSKIKKFHISDPFLKFFAEKYEKEIPWQLQVKDETTLNRFIQQTLIPKFMDRIDLSITSDHKKNFYISKHHISLQNALDSQEHSDDADIQNIKLLRMEQGDEKALEALISLINRRKYQAFILWIKILDEHYPNDFAFKLLLLRPLFELAGHGTRRTVIEPSVNAISWIYQRIQRSRLLPNDNIAFQYCLKLSASTHLVNGWQYITADVSNAAKLNAICSGSGWCIAGRYYASYYLKTCKFYILTVKNKPVAALRLSQNNRVLEHRGRYNHEPVEWMHDIWFLLETLNIDTSFRNAIRPTPKCLDGMSGEWWQERTKLWSFAALLAPKNIKHNLQHQIQNTISHYIEFPKFHELAKLAGITIDKSIWCAIVESNPIKYHTCPSKFKELDDIQQACINGWILNLRDDQITLSDIENIPEFVKHSRNFSQQFAKYFPSSIRQAIRKNPSTRKDRFNRFSMEKVIPITIGESQKVACERMISALLNNEDGVYTDDIYYELLQQRNDYATIREQAWLEGIKAHPPLWFALPKDLRKKEIFKLTHSSSRFVNLEEWSKKVKNSPWLLTQKKTVPKSIRMHPQIIRAYRDGWSYYLKDSPWQIWVKFKKSYRVYMSYALLNNTRTINAMTDGWIATGTNILTTWRSKPSERMKSIPAVQLSILRALNDEKLIGKLKKKEISIFSLGICSDIEHINKNKTNTLIINKIKLIICGIRQKALQS